MTTLSDLTAGTYSVSETPPTGWRLVSVDCFVNGFPVPDPLNLVLNPMDAVECIFVDEKTVDLKIKKISGATSGTFTFDVTGPLGPLPLVVITTDDADADGIFMAMQTLFELPAGPYSVVEQPLAGWTEISSDCAINQVPGFDPDNFVLNPMDFAECTFVDEQIVSIKIIKESGAFAGTFDFTVTALSGPVTPVQIITTDPDLDGMFMGMDTLSVNPGTFSVVELIQLGWLEISVTCTINGTTVNPLNIVLGPLQSAQCIFVDEKTASIKITKQSGEFPGVFNFDIMGPTGLSEVELTTIDPDLDGMFMSMATVSNLPQGTYSIIEEQQPDWRLISVDCTINGFPANPANLVLNPMDSAECIFVDEKTVSLKIIKQSGAFAGTFNFEVENSDGIITPVVITGWR